MNFIGIKFERFLSESYVYVARFVLDVGTASGKTCVVDYVRTAVLWQHIIIKLCYNLRSENECPKYKPICINRYPIGTYANQQLRAEGS